MNRHLKTLIYHLAIFLFIGGNLWINNDYGKSDETKKGLSDIVTSLSTTFNHIVNERPHNRNYKKAILDESEDELVEISPAKIITGNSYFLHPSIFHSASAYLKISLLSFVCCFLLGFKNLHLIKLSKIYIRLQVIRL